MRISGTARASHRRFRRRLAAAAVAVGAFAGLAMPTHGGPTAATGAPPPAAGDA